MRGNEKHVSAFVYQGTLLNGKPIIRSFVLAVIVHIIVLSQAVNLILRSGTLPKIIPLSIKLSRPDPGPEPVMHEVASVVPPLPNAEPAAAPLPMEPPPQPAAQPELPATETLIITAEAAAHILGRLPDEPGAEIIARQQHAFPSNWSRPIIALSENRFAYAWLPQKPQVLDLWQNGDGSQQNKMRLPNGMLLCGRKAANELFEPLVIPIWTYHGC